MRLLAAALAGAGFGYGLYLTGRVLFPPAEPLARVLAGFDAPQRSNTDSSGLADRLGAWTLGVLEASSLVDTDRIQGRLRILGQTPEEHAYRKLVVGIAAFSLPILIAVLLAAAGVGMSAGFVGLAAVGLGIAGSYYPDLGLAEQVEQRRRGFRHALSAYLDLVTVILAGGGGLETALWEAADAGEGWAFAEIRRALRRAQLSGRTPWDVFDDLGAELGVGELSELAASARLAGDRGARIKASLAAKADSMRAQQTAAIEARSEAATEMMLLPVIGLVVGMILFIGYGVVEAISTPTNPIP